MVFLPSDAIILGCLVESKISIRKSNLIGRWRFLESPTYFQPLILINYKLLPSLDNEDHLHYFQ